MKKGLFGVAVIAIVTFGVIGCGGGPGEGTEEEAKASMDASMQVDTMAETETTETNQGTPTAP